MKLSTRVQIWFFEASLKLRSFFPLRVRMKAYPGLTLTLALLFASQSPCGAQQPGSFFPDVPPRASLIQVSAPNSAGDVTVTGAPGSVPGSSFVVLVTLDTGHVTQTQAALDGSFSALLFAPAGTSIMIKVDQFGLVAPGISGQLLISAPSLSPLPGTVVRVSDPSSFGGTLSFAGAGLTQFGSLGGSPLPAWTFQGTISGNQFHPGSTVRIQGTLKVVSSALQGAGPMRVLNGVSLELLSTAGGLGRFARNSYASIFLTPTDLPIERGPAGPFFDVSVDQFKLIDLIKVAPDRAEAVVDLSLTIPADFAAGFYQPLINFNFQGVPAESSPSRPVFMLIDLAQRRLPTTLRAPIIQVGNPAAPRLFWTLLSDTLSNGTRGASAVEDRTHFGLASRVLTQSETFIVPRLDSASGRPFIFRLEPFAPIVSLSDRSPPSPPLIPFRFPSGSLTARVRSPDGSVLVIGPAAFVQSRMKSLADQAGNLLGAGGGHIDDLYELSTMDPRFEVQFSQDGLHVIELAGTIEDIWGNVWNGGGTYEVYVARTLALDTAVLPGTPFEVGDVFQTGLVVSPPVPAELEVRVRLAPNSDPSQMIERTVTGRANRFGYFHGAGILLDQPGEYRVDIKVSFQDAQGNLWMGSRTWGSVVAPPNPEIIAHGRRGISAPGAIGPQWFFRTQTGIPIGGNVPFPFHSGDIMWMRKTDSAIPLVTFQDLSGSLVNLLRSRLNLVGLTPPGSFDERAAVGELPLFSSRPDRREPHLDPSKVDLWAYSYRSVQRPLVRVREEISEEFSSGFYWDFFEQYAAQIGVGRLGDLPNDIKFQYGAAVLRGSALGQPKYAIHGSLFVLVPDNDPRGGTRTFPPFQGNGGGPSGGPIMTLQGRQIDLFIHLTGVRPGSVLEVGNTFALSGAVGPTLPALVNYTVTKPDGQQLSFSGRANKVGYYYRPENDFIVDQPGIYTVDLRVNYDGLTSAGQVTQPFPTGDVLGTANGRFFVYVVSQGSVPLQVDLPPNAFLAPPAQFGVNAIGPAGMNLTGGHVTTLMPGFILETGSLSGSGGKLNYQYNPTALSSNFPNLDVGFLGAADLITVTLFGSGTNPDGTPAFAARVVTLHGQELFTQAHSLPSLVAAVLPSSRSVQVGVPATAFATIINAGSSTTPGCNIVPITGVPGTFLYQTTNPATNQITGTPNTPVSIGPGVAQSFVIALSPSTAMASTDVRFSFNCANGAFAPIIFGLNTLLFSASVTPTPDIVALGATITNDGIVNIPGSNGAGAFAVATVNVGASGSITASADTGSAILPVNIALCQTDPANGQCISSVGPSVTTQIDANATPTFGIFVGGVGNIAFNPAVNRIFVRFRDGGGVTRGSTSVAVRTQ